jgi:hypothetical protein
MKKMPILAFVQSTLHRILRHLNAEIVASGTFQELKDWQPYHMLHKDGREIAIPHSGKRTHMQ